MFFFVAIIVTSDTKFNVSASATPLSIKSPLPEGMCTEQAYGSFLSHNKMFIHFCVYHAGHVKVKNLTLIKWKDDGGEIQLFYLRENIAHKWRTIGELLDMTNSKLQSLADEHRDKLEECCRAVLGHWLENPPLEYPTTWQGLIDLLEDSQLGQVVTQLRTALSKAINL